MTDTPLDSALIQSGLSRVAVYAGIKAVIDHCRNSQVILGDVLLELFVNAYNGELPQGHPNQQIIAFLEQHAKDERVATAMAIKRIYLESDMSTIPQSRHLKELAQAAIACLIEIAREGK